MSGIIRFVYGGRFQPPHLGHLAVYRWACAEFGEVFVASSKKRADNSPFSFETKQRIWAEWGVSLHYSALPAFKPSEIVGPDDVYVAIVGHKDRDRYQSKYFHEYKNNIEYEPFSVRGYYAISPVMEFGLSASMIRANIHELNKYYNEPICELLRKEYHERGNEGASGKDERDQQQSFDRICQGR